MMPALEIKDLRKVYETGLEALKGISLEVEQGDFFALLGPNGAGKSTTLGIVSSLTNKSSGTVRIFGKDLDTETSACKQLLGVVPQEFNFNQFEKVYDILITQAGYYGIAAKQASSNTEKYLRQLGLWEKRNEAARLLSGGMKRRLMIARALVHDPKLLILDEPTAGVDIELRRSMWDFLRQINRQGTTIILTTHYLEEAESLCRNIAIINKGQILQHSGKKEMLRQLHAETYVLELNQQIDSAPELDGFDCAFDSDGNLEVKVMQDQGLDQLFRALEPHKLGISSMRAKANRLEELFVSLVEDDS